MPGVDPGRQTGVLVVHHYRVSSLGRTGWFAAGVLAASLGFVLLVLAADIVRAFGSAPDREASMPPVVIEAR
jgi:hypothetical protein